MYLVKTPAWLRALYPSLTWRIPTDEKILYLTFDDGPHEKATPFVLNQLQQHQAKATFFCIGKNVAEQPAVYHRIINEGHKVANHTHNHLNGWKTPNSKYISNVFEAAKFIDSDLLRPPYGKISRFQAKVLQQNNRFKIIMWDVLSADFDTRVTPQKCRDNVVLHAKPGSIIVFHDSAKAFDRMSYALPQVLQHFSTQGYTFKTLQEVE